jgi:hypothetical protein
MAWRMKERRASSPLPTVPVGERNLLCNTRRLDTVVIEEDDRAACDERITQLGRIAG